MNSKFILLILVFLNRIICNAQFQNNNWYFGNSAAINFQKDTAKQVIPSSLVSVEGCASVSDQATGKLLFYTDGVKVWNANNTIMPNGNKLLGGSNTSATQACVIVPFPKKNNKYFIFTVDEFESGNTQRDGFRYSIVDMTLDNGLGDVELQNKSVLVNSNSTERLTVTLSENGDFYWVVIHEFNNANFKVYKIDENGLNKTPVISTIGDVYKANGVWDSDEMGMIKISNNSKKLVSVLRSSKSIQLFDFDNCTGKITSPVTIANIGEPYGVEFSPDNQFLYVSTFEKNSRTNGIYQLDLNASNIRNSAILVGRNTSTNVIYFGALQNAPNGKMYITTNSDAWLSSIEFPNVRGVNCQFVKKSIIFDAVGTTKVSSIFGLPQAVPNLIKDFEPIEVKEICSNQPVSFQLNQNIKANNIFWDLGDLSSSTDTSTLRTHLYTYNKTGSFDIKCYVSNSCGVDTFNRFLTLDSCIIENCTIKIPNVFTPNNDSLNEKYKIEYSCLPEFYKMKIFNRWGETLWQSKDIDSEWDGSCNQVNCSSGVYYYIVEYKFKNNQRITTNGIIHLIR